MSAPIRIKGSKGQDAAHVTEGGQLNVVTHSHPPIESGVISFPFAQWFTDTGLSTGDNNMLVDGSTTPQQFTINANENQDVFIKTISLRISDTGAALNEFGALAALTNGVSFEHTTGDTGTVVILDEMKENMDMLRLFQATQGVGDGSTAYQLALSGAGQDTYLMSFDFAQTFGFPWGLRLRRGSRDRLGFTIRDDLSSGISVFNARGFGIQL